MAAEHKTREEQLLESVKNFQANAYKIILEMVELWNLTASDYTTALLDEGLHSIFFLGKIMKPPQLPEKIVDDENMLECLKKSFPRPFELYCSQLPKRSPISCVLEMIVHLIGEKNEAEVKKRLQTLNHQLSRGRKAKHLISSTMCVSQNTEIKDSLRYYGVSMSTSGGIAGQIMVAASCVNYWDNYVADAVMTYYINKTKNKYFDGTITVPEIIRCQAFEMKNGEIIPPCTSCWNMFGLPTTVEKIWAYGNCAEVESLSNLLKNEEEIKKQARPTSDTYTDQNRQNAKRRAIRKLEGLLKDVGFTWDKKFYPNKEVPLKRKFQ